MNRIAVAAFAVYGSALLCVVWWCGWNYGRAVQPEPTGYKTVQLFAAVRSSDHDCVARLLDSGGDVNAYESKYGWTLLTVAAQQGDLKMVALLVSRGADVRRGHPLLHACEAGYEDICRFLILSGADPGIPLFYGVPNCLLMAARNGHADVVRLLIAAGVCPNQGDANWAPLYWAAASGHAMAVMQLVTGGAEVNLAGSSGVTALHAACRNGYVDVARILLASGANAQSRTVSGLTPRDMALQGCFLDVVAVLDEHTAGRK